MNYYRYRTVRQYFFILCYFIPNITTDHCTVILYMLMKVDDYCMVQVPGTLIIMKKNYRIAVLRQCTQYYYELVFLYFFLKKKKRKERHVNRLPFPSYLQICKYVPYTSEPYHVSKKRKLRKMYTVIMPCFYFIYHFIIITLARYDSVQLSFVSAQSFLLNFLPVSYSTLYRTVAVPYLVLIIHSLFF